MLTTDRGREIWAQVAAQKAIQLSPAASRRHAAQVDYARRRANHAAAHRRWLARLEADKVTP